MSTQFDEEEVSVQRVTDAIDEEFSATIYLKPSRMGADGKRRASLVIEPEVDMLCTFDPKNINYQDRVLDASYPGPFEDSLSIELNEIESNEVLRDLLSCLEVPETDN